MKCRQVNGASNKQGWVLRERGTPCHWRHLLSVSFHCFQEKLFSPCSEKTWILNQKIRQMFPSWHLNHSPRPPAHTHTDTDLHKPVTLEARRGVTIIGSKEPHLWQIQLHFFRPAVGGAAPPRPQTPGEVGQKEPFGLRRLGSESQLCLLPAL